MQNQRPDAYVAVYLNEDQEHLLKELQQKATELGLDLDLDLIPCEYEDEDEDH